MITGMIYAAAVLGGIGLLTGLFLGIASERLKADTDEKQFDVTKCYIPR